MKKHIAFLLLSLLFFSINLSSKNSQPLVQRVEPTSWWVGMRNPELQVMLYGKNIQSSDIKLNDPNVLISKIEKTENPDYLFIYLTISPATQPGELNIQIKNGKRKQTVLYSLKARAENSAWRKSFTEADNLYLLMPDRFANGNVKNDSIKGYIQGVNRKDPGARHGGDIDGIISKIPYLADLGITALWTTPLFDDNDSKYSYHHYACTDYYKVDPRLGTNEDYQRLAEVCHQNSIKLIIDVVPNHCGASHWWMKDLPAKDWLNTWDTYTSSNYRMTVWTDPHAAKADLKRLINGWFAPNMPDLNLKNRLLFDYLKQVYIYWMEYAGIDGVRVDTYPYNDIHVASDFMKSIRYEYPNINIVGECWVKTPAEIAYYQSGNNNKDGFDSNLTSVMDFVLKDVFEKSFNEPESWDGGLARFYAHFAQDFVYQNPNLVMNFLDNHDIDRYATKTSGDINKYKMALAVLTTVRGYPQIYYGTEIMLDGIAGNYEGHRFDFPGGWSKDKRNAFTADGRTASENDVFNYLRKLLNYRKNNPVMQNGKMKQFIPENGFYVYFRYNADKTVMVVVNNNDTTKQLDLSRFSEMFGGKTEAKEITNGQLLQLNVPLEVPAKTVFVSELR